MRVFIRNIYKYMDKRDLKTYLSYTIDESSKLPIVVGIIGDVYRGESAITWIYRSVQGSLSDRESEQNGCKEYFKSRMNMKKIWCLNYLVYRWSWMNRLKNYYIRHLRQLFEKGRIKIKNNFIIFVSIVIIQKPKSVKLFFTSLCERYLKRHEVCGNSVGRVPDERSFV